MSCVRRLVPHHAGLADHFEVTHAGFRRGDTAILAAAVRVRPRTVNTVYLRAIYEVLHAHLFSTIGLEQVFYVSVAADFAVLSFVGGRIVTDDGVDEGSDFPGIARYTERAFRFQSFWILIIIYYRRGCWVLPSKVNIISDLEGAKPRAWRLVAALQVYVMRDIEHGHVVAHHVVYLDQLVDDMSVALEPFMLEGLGGCRPLLGVRLEHPE